MNLAKTCLAVVVGFLLGAFVYHPVTAKASSPGSGTIYVRKVVEGGSYTDPMLANREIVGFSCTGGSFGSQCFVAAR